MPRPHHLKRKRVWWPLSDLLVVQCQQNVISHWVFSIAPHGSFHADTNNIGNLVFMKYLNVLIYNLQVQCKQASIHQAHRQQI